MAVETLRPNDLSEAERVALVEADRDLARVVARQHRGQGLSVDEMESTALLGLWKAACVYDPGRGVPFRSYAFWWAKAKVRRELLYERRGGIRFPPPTGVRRAYRPRHASDEGLDLHELAPDRGPDPAAAAAAREQLAWSACLRLLPPTERRVAELRYGHGLSKVEAAALLGVSPERLRQVETGLVWRLRRAVAQGRVPAVTGGQSP